jgi:hypothetical protein
VPSDVELTMSETTAITGPASTKPAEDQPAEVTYYSPLQLSEEDHDDVREVLDSLTVEQVNEAHTVGLEIVRLDHHEYVARLYGTEHPGVFVLRGGVGGKKLVIHPDMLYEAAKSHASYDHLGRMFGVSGMTLSRTPIFHDLIEKARAEACVNLSAAQFHAATVQYNPAMLIWLGKQYLGQVDTRRSELSGPNGRPVEFQEAKAVLYVPGNGRDEVSAITGPVRDLASQPDGLLELPDGLSAEESE